MFRLEIETDNAAFDEGDRDLEVARLLRVVADRVETGDYSVGEASNRVRDINGGTVGSFYLDTE